VEHVTYVQGRRVKGQSHGKYPPTAKVCLAELLSLYSWCIEAS